MKQEAEDRGGCGTGRACAPSRSGCGHACDPSHLLPAWQAPALPLSYACPGSTSAGPSRRGERGMQRLQLCPAPPAHLHGDDAAGRVIQVHGGHVLRAVRRLYPEGLRLDAGAVLGQGRGGEGRSSSGSKGDNTGGGEGRQGAAGQGGRQKNGGKERKQGAQAASCCLGPWAQGPAGSTGQAGP